MNRKIFINWAFVIFIVVVVFLGCASPGELPKAEILKTANAKAAAMGYDLRRMKVFVDRNNSTWKGWLNAGPSKIARDPVISNTLAQLSGRDFLSIYYSPEPRVFGGDFFIFLDRHSGEVITTLAFQ